MRIGFYTDTYLPNTDGVVSQIVASKRELEKRGHFVQVFTTGTPEEKKRFQSTTADYSTGYKFPLYPQYKIAWFPFKSTLIAKKKRLDLIHCHALASMGIASVATAKALNLPLVGTFHTMIPLTAHYLTQNKNAQRAITEVSWKAIEGFYKPFDLVTAPSHVIAELLESHGVENVRVVSNGIDVQQFKPRNGLAIRKKLKVKQSEPLFMFVGRITKEKRVDIVLRAFANIKEKAKLAIVGNGPYLKEIEKLSRKLKLGDKVTLTGQVQHNEMPSYFAACNWQVTASTFETQGLGILEGMACGKPCIGANSLAIPETVKHNRNGLIFKEMSVSDCAEKMQQALEMNNSAKYRQLCQNAVRTAKQHAIQKTTDQWEKLYAEVTPL